MLIQTLWRSLWNWRICLCWHFFEIFLSFGSFHLVYLLKAHMKLNGRKWLDEMEQRNSEKNQKFLVLNDKWLFGSLTFNSRADIITRYKFNQVRCFFTFGIGFMVWWDTPVKYMNNKFQFLTNIYVYTGYFIGFTFWKISFCLSKLRVYLVVLNS